VAYSIIAHKIKRLNSGDKNPIDYKVAIVSFSVCGNCRNCHGTLSRKKQKHIVERTILEVKKE